MSFLAQRDQAALVPFDHRRQRIDDQQRCDFAVFQRRRGRVAEPEPADDDIPVRAFQFGQSQVRQRLFHLMEQTRHQKRVAQLHFVNLDPA